MPKPFEATKDLLKAIDHDVKLAKDPAEFFFIGVLFPILAVPPTAIADTLRAPIDKIREVIKQRRK
ncbi:unnamed protein product [marine sediment metagenome]|uniref:Uncharacterized protein n=1 Tax=marine sediment metagenome TaxID=412755 RepID=X1MSH8_9ZZZZ